MLPNLVSQCGSRDPSTLFIRFEADQPQVVAAPVGLRDASTQAGFRTALTERLIQSRLPPGRASVQQRLAATANARKQAGDIVDGLTQTSSNLSVSDYVLVLDAAEAGASAQDIVAGITARAMPAARPSASEGSPRPTPTEAAINQWKHTLGCVCSVEAMIGVASVAGLRQVRFAPPDHPFPSRTLQDMLRRPFDDSAAVTADSACSDLIWALRTDPAVCETVLDHLNWRLYHLSNDWMMQRSSGVWNGATSWILNMHPDVLRRLVVSRRDLEWLAANAWLVLGHLASSYTSVQGHPLHRRAAMTGSSPAMAQALSTLASEFFQTPAGQAIAKQFSQSLMTLLETVMRVESFEQMPESSQPDVMATPVFDALDKYVPRGRIEVPEIDFFPRAGASRFALPLLREQPPAAVHPPAARTEPLPPPPETKEPPLVLHAVPPESPPESKTANAKPHKARKKKDREKDKAATVVAAEPAVLAAPAHTDEQALRREAAVRVAAVRMGTRVPGAPAHDHARRRKKLSAADRLRTEAELQDFVLNGPRGGTWGDIKELRRQEREAAARSAGRVEGPSTPGGRLVAPEYYA